MTKQITKEAQIKALTKQVNDLEGQLNAYKDVLIEANQVADKAKSELINANNQLVLARERHVTLLQAIRVQAGHDLQVSREPS